jgi:RNA polymerase sporulation-specific sigma factor
LGSEEESISFELEQREERQMVRDAVECLAPRERELIELRYGMRTGKEMTQKEVADLLGISQSYISRLEKRILANLKETLAGKI